MKQTPVEQTFLFTDNWYHNQVLLPQVKVNLRTKVILNWLHPSQKLQSPNQNLATGCNLSLYSGVNSISAGIIKKSQPE